jgi:hypothetical protein
MWHIWLLAAAVAEQGIMGLAAVLVVLGREPDCQ